MRLLENASKEKLRGGFYTPQPITDFILTWAINGGSDADILEPSCGDGNFLKSLKTGNFKFNSLTAVEYDPIEALKAQSIELNHTEVINDDFHCFCNSTKKRFDLVVGNPPYIRYQYFDKNQQVAAEDIFIKAGLKYSKLTNAWVSFVVGSSLLLKESGGKIGFVLPAEILQVSYGQQLRNFLAHFYNKINIISFEKLVFPDIQQEVVLLLCEKDNTKNHNIDHIELKDASELYNLDLYRLKFPKKISDALFIRRNNIYPKLIVNEANAYTTDTMHRVFLKAGTDLNAFTASYYNSLSLAFAEVSGRSHGGGVLELMPNETERILLPYHVTNSKLLGTIDGLIRQKSDIRKIMERTNKQILQENYGLSDKDIELSDSIWNRLSNRRLNRGK